MNPDWIGTLCIAFFILGLQVLLIASLICGGIGRYSVNIISWTSLFTHCPDIYLFSIPHISHIFYTSVFSVHKVTTKIARGSIFLCSISSGFPCNTYCSAFKWVNNSNPYNQGDFVHNGDFETGHLGAWQCTGSHCNILQDEDGGFVANSHHYQSQSEHA